MKKFEWKTIKQRIGKGKKKVIAVTVVLCIVAATAGTAISKPGKSSAEESSAVSTTVRTSTIKDSVSGTGTISYASTTDIEVPSDLEMDEILVSEGTYVEQGALLATVDETSLAVCITDVEDAISELDSTITSELTSTTTRYIKAGVSGTVEKIYGEEGDSVADVMAENGALMLVKNGETTISVIGSEGTISSVNVSEGSTVSASTKVFTFKSDAQSSEYLQAVKDREELVSILETLISIKKNGGIVASVEGMVETINVSGTVSSGNSDSASATNGNKAVGSMDSTQEIAEDTTDIAASYGTDDNTDNNTDDKVEKEYLTAVNNSAGDNTVHNITAVRMTNLSSPSVTSESTITAPGIADLTGITEERSQALKDLKAGVGRIDGTKKDMEYADREDAGAWKECSDGYTEVSAGTWYVRYKATENETASAAVKIEVVETADSSESNTQTGVDAAGTNGETSSSGNNSAGADGKASDNNGGDGSSTQTGNTGNGTNGQTGNTGNSSNGQTGNTGNSSNGQTGNTDNGTNGQTGNAGNGSTTQAGNTGDGSTTQAGNAGDGSTGTLSRNGDNSGSSKSTGGSNSSSGMTGSGSSSVGVSSSGSSSSSSKSIVSTVNAFIISNGDRMKVTMNVDELDILTMEEGLSAEITLDAVENTTFEGTITNVSGSASSGNGTAQYPVEITFDKTEEMLSGMNASVAVIIEEAEDVLTVPLAAISDEGRSSYVYTGYDESSGELTGKTEVTLGMSDENSVEIKNGLSEGDTIYYKMQGSEDSDGRSGLGGMDGMGMPGMDGERPSGGFGDGERSSGGFGDGERPFGGNGGERPSGNNGGEQGK